jgi:hypothetical protein
MKNVFYGVEGFDGVEYRYDEDGDLDEIVVLVQGRCILHVERMHDTYFWMGISTDKIEASATFGAKNGRSHVKFTTAEAFPSHDDSQLPTLLSMKGILAANPGGPAE